MYACHWQTAALARQPVVPRLGGRAAPIHPVCPSCGGCLGIARARLAAVLVPGLPYLGYGL